MGALLEKLGREEAPDVRIPRDAIIEAEFSGPAGMHDPDLDDLPVRLVFELGRVELSLGELQRLARGALVPLARPVDEPLDIMANGRRLGRGTLVQIGDSLGVRIVSLAGNE
jgi:type III secretion protein Q